MKHFLTLLALAAIPAAHGAIVYSGVQNIPIPFTFSGVYVNVFTNLTSLTEPVDFYDTAPWINLDFGGVDISNGDMLHLVITGTDQALNLASLSLVASSSNFTVGSSASTTHMGSAPNQFQLNTPGYVGFSFNPAPAGPTYYGWMQISIDNTGTGTGTIHDWAYENVAGAPILAGIVPEPTGPALLLLVLGGMALRRRR